MLASLLSSISQLAKIISTFLKQKNRIVILSEEKLLFEVKLSKHANTLKLVLISSMNISREKKHQIQGKQGDTHVTNLQVQCSEIVNIVIYPYK